MSDTTPAPAAIAQAKAEALREAARDLSWFGAQGNTVHPDTAWAGICACMKALKSTADKILADAGLTLVDGDDD